MIEFNEDKSFTIKKWIFNLYGQKAKIAFLKKSRPTQRSNKSEKKFIIKVREKVV